MSIEQPQGRLAVIRWRPPLLQADFDTFLGDVRQTVLNASRPLVFFTDWRGNARLDDDIIDTVVWIMRRDNPQIERTGLLISPGHAQMKQHAERVVDEANNPVRRVFDDPARCREWLVPLLDDAETAALDEQLASG